MLRRPAGPSAGGDLLGEREPGGAALLLRRKQALHRSPHHGVSPQARRAHEHRAHLQYVRPAHEAGRRPRGAGVSGPGPARPAPHGLRRRLANAQLLLRERHGGGAVPADALRGALPGEPGESERDDDPGIRRTHPPHDREPAGDRVPAAARGRPQAAPPRYRKARALLGWEPRVPLEEGLRLTVEYFRGLSNPARTTESPVELV